MHIRSGSSNWNYFSPLQRFVYFFYKSKATLFHYWFDSPFQRSMKKSRFEKKSSEEYEYELSKKEFNENSWKLSIDLPF